MTTYIVKWIDNSRSKKEELFEFRCIADFRLIQLEAYGIKAVLWSIIDNQLVDNNKNNNKDNDNNKNRGLTYESQ